MGTEITLAVGGMTVAWSKNGIGMDHGALYQEHDRKRLLCNQIDYEYFEREGEDPEGYEQSFSRSLRTMVPRLEMIGYRLETIREIYDSATRQWREDRLSVADLLEEHGGKQDQVPLPMSFDEYLAFVRAHPLKDLSEVFVDYEDASRQKIMARFNSKDIERIPSDKEGMNWAYSEKSYFAAVIGFMDPYSTLRLMAECPANLDLTVDWHYGALIENGWATLEEFVPCARRQQTFLIATEGSSDVHILQHALKLLRPDLTDFFRFIDVSERHPFSGTGSLVKFAEGLAKIDVQNNIVFLFDNDAEGVEAFKAISRFKLPSNMTTLVLPCLEQFRQFPALGPNGVITSDINGRAAAIECYLDLSQAQYEPAKIVWTNYKRESGVYQGALEYKESYAKAFFEQTSESIRDGRYDVSKIEQVLDALIDECCRLAVA
jgi:hypothetical protein